MASETMVRVSYDFFFTVMMFLSYCGRRFRLGVRQAVVNSTVRYRQAVPSELSNPTNVCFVVRGRAAQVDYRLRLIGGNESIMTP
jgi:hypothetical protein